MRRAFLNRVITALIVSGAVACGQATPPAPAANAAEIAAPATLGLRTVPLASFTTAEPTVRAQMEARRAALDTAIANPSDTRALAEAYGALGMLLHAATAFDGAEACYRNAQQLVPDEPRWPYYLAQLFRSRGPVDEAVRWFERTRVLRPRDVATLVYLGDAYLSQGQPTLASPVFDEALALAEPSAAAHLGAGRAALARRDFAAAVPHLERALALEPGASGIHYPLAMAYRGRGELQKAEAQLALKGDVDPRPPDPLMRELDVLLESAEAYNLRGGAELAAGRWAEAAALFRKGLEIRPSDPSLRHRLGTALAQMGDGPGAVNAFETVIRSNPDFARAYFSLGVLAAEARQFDIAIRQFQAALQQESGYVEARVQLAWALARSGRPGEALPHFEQATALEPTHYEAMFGSAMAYIQLQRYREARDRLVASLTLYPDQAVLKHALARLLAAAPDDRVRDGRRAKALVDELLKGGQSLELGETTAMMLAETGDFPKALLLQRDLITGAERANLSALLPRLRNNLARYERREPCRVPFSDEELR